MIKSFKDIKNRKEIFPDDKLVEILRKEFPNKTKEAINKACLITKNSYDLSCILLKSECKLDANKFDSNNLQVESDYLNIILYKNGIKIDKEFFDYKIEKNREILQNLQNRKIDERFLGNDSDGYAKIIDKTNETYNINAENVNIKNEGVETNNEKEEKKSEKKGFTISELRKMNKK